MKKRSRQKTICDHCGKTFQKDKHDFKRTSSNFCSQKCNGQHKKQLNTIITNCEICNKQITKIKSQFEKSKSGKSFCSRSCAASYNNKLKRKSHRSKIEAKFYNLLITEFPNLDILPNDKTMLDGLEVDIAIPSLKLAIE